MNRLTVIKDLMKQRNLRDYLEIGVHTGYIFFRIKSTFKVAVDPGFEFGSMGTWNKAFNFPYNLYNKYFEITSDDFFLKHAKDVFKQTKPDIIFIDGMHEYQFALRDIENTLQYMPDNGVIVVHDCNPKSKEAGSSFKEFSENAYGGFWNGDVWKAILHLRCMRKDVNVFVLDCDHGLGIITKKTPESTLPFTQADIEKFDYDDFAKNREQWLNLKRPEYFYEYFKITDTSNRSFRKIVKSVLVALHVLPGKKG